MRRQRSTVGLSCRNRKPAGYSKTFAVQVADGKATADGVLAGSVLTLDRALSNFIGFTNAPLEQALRLLTTNPAAMTGLEDQAGSLAVGMPANLVAVDARGRLVASLLHGQAVTV